MINESWHTYPTIYALGHRALAPLLSGPVVVEEKIDGSQFSFGRFGDELRCRSKGKNIFLDAPEKMFLPAIEYVKSIKTQHTNGFTYRAEFLSRPKHNVLAYDRTPRNYLIIFDINTGHESYKTPARWAKAVQHLREAGTLEGSPRDIGALIEEVGTDTLKECHDEIVSDILEWALPHVKRSLIRGLPEWYKEQLAKTQFEAPHEGL